VETISDSLDKDYAQAWRPSPGEKLVGAVVALNEREGPFGSYPIVTIRTPEGRELAAHCFHEVLASELARLAPAVGDEIGVKYLGKHPERGYHQYRARRVGGDRGFNWSRYGGSASSQLPVDTPHTGSISQRDTSASTGGAIDDPDDIPFFWDGPFAFDRGGGRPHQPEERLG
jgi:hypothetical protein